MSVYALINPNAPIVNGAAVCQPVGSGYILDNPQRELKYNSIAGMNLTEKGDGSYLAGDWLRGNPTAPASTGDYSGVGTPNAQVFVDYPAAGPYRCHEVAGVSWSYSGAPTGGHIQVEDGSGNVVWGQSVTASGPGSALFPPPDQKRGSPNTEMIIRLSAGGASVSGEVSVLGHRIV